MLTLKPQLPPHVVVEPSTTNARSKSTWDAIREANSQSAGKHSAWDELRQRHERQRVSGRVAMSQNVPEVEDPRAKAQAEFDAILEAERKAAKA